MTACGADVTSIVKPVGIWLQGLLRNALLPIAIGVCISSTHVQASQHPFKAEVSRGRSHTRHRPADLAPLRTASGGKVRNQAHSSPRSGVRLRARRVSRPLPLVMVDAGHGGRDAGAIGPSGTLEKTVALATAQQLGRQLRATGRYRVVFTRDGDSFVSLTERVRLAVANRAALMISIHADASADRMARGASVYVRPAQSAGPDVAHLPAHRDSSRSIARALAEPPALSPGSARLQFAMIGSLNDDLVMVPDPARQGRFHVLGALGIPSVLVETGFITNKQDEALLRTPRHRTMVARAIRDAVNEFFAGQQRQHVPRT